MSNPDFFDGSFDSPEGVAAPVSPQVLRAMLTNANLLYDLSQAGPNGFVSFVVCPMDEANNEQDITVGADNSTTNRIINDILVTTGARQLGEAIESPSGQTMTLFTGVLGSTGVAYFEKVVDTRPDEHGNPTTDVKLIGSMRRPIMPERVSATKESKLRKLTAWIFGS